MAARALLEEPAPAAGAPPPLSLAAEAAQFALTERLRALLVRECAGGRFKPGSERLRHETANLLERWLVALANLPEPATPGWARLYRVTAPETPVNAKLAAELVEGGFVAGSAAAAALVRAVLDTVACALSRDPRRPPKKGRPLFAPSAVCGARELAFGDLFRAEATPRLRQLVVLGGCDATLGVAMRYAALQSGGQQWALPQRHVDFLYAEHGVRREAFASPLNARLLGKPDAAYCSLFPDVDAPFGSIGSFFRAEPGPPGANWVVNPPFVETLLTAAARRVLFFLESGPRVAFFIIPAWQDSHAYLLLHESRFCAAERFCRAGEYFYEDAAGRRVNTRASSIYFALSSEPAPDAARLASALAQLGRD